MLVGQPFTAGRSQRLEVAVKDPHTIWSDLHGLESRFAHVSKCKIRRVRVSRIPVPVYLACTVKDRLARTCTTEERQLTMLELCVCGVSEL